MTRDELIDILYAHGGHFDCSIEHVADEILEAMGDVQQVVHGKWNIDDDYLRESGYMSFICSNCGSKRFWSEIGNYCKKCGAKMI